MKVKKIKSYEKVTRMNGVVLYDDSTVRTDQIPCTERRQVFLFNSESSCIITVYR
jgi:hypothetical protein